MEPGLDLHLWETRWQDLQDAAADAPDETLPEMVQAIEEMLVERGYQLDEPITAEGEDPEIIRQFVAALQTARLAETGKAEREDVLSAIDDLRAVYEYLVTDRAAP
jgi:hypothetical protein